MTALVRETAAAAYTDAADLHSRCGIDLIHSDVERDDDGTVLARTEAGYDEVPASAWGVDAAEAALADGGWRRVGPWTWNDDLGGVPGWTAPVERVEAAR